MDSKDFKQVMSKLLTVLVQGMPSVTGFLGGFLLGVRM
jgi:hypothetical protein